ncbi:hypothetical protein FRB96_007708 [Tulasnella sp. 330]|nr:hypothetical protein FRB96_007708 [Tulasnella sp. 330]
MLKRFTRSHHRLRPTRSVAGTDASHSPAIFRLAIELLLMLADYLEEDDILALLFTCHAMRTAMELYLYKHIVIPPYQRNRIHQVLRTLCARPDLARSTVSFNGYLSPAFYDNSFDAKAHDLSRPYWILRDRAQRIKAEKEVDAFEKILMTALGKMSNLRSLNLLGLDLDAWPRTLQLLREAVSRLHLTSLRVNNSAFDHLIPSTAHAIHPKELMHFIHQQPLLEHLSLPKGPAIIHNQQFRSTDIPLLRSLAATGSDAALIVPGRPVSSLTLFEDVSHGATDDLWRAVATSTAPLTHVTLRWTNWSGFALNLEAIAAHLRHLENLTLQNIWEGEDFDTIRRNAENAHIDQEHETSEAARKRLIIK